MRPNKNWLIGKDLVAGKDWRQEEKGMMEDKIVGWHHRLDGHEVLSDWTDWWGIGDCCRCSVAKLCPTLCGPMDCSMRGSLVLHYLPELVQSCPLSQWCHLTISSSVTPFSFCLQSFPASGSFPMSRLFTSGSQSTEAWASASVLPMSIQGDFL